MLGGHSEVNMLFESVGSDTTSLIGKKILQISFWSTDKLDLLKELVDCHLINRIVNLDFKIKNKHHRKDLINFKTFYKGL